MPRKTSCLKLHVPVSGNKTNSKYRCILAGRKFGWAVITQQAMKVSEKLFGWWIGSHQIQHGTVRSDRHLCQSHRSFPGQSEAPSSGIIFMTYLQVDRVALWQDRNYDVFFRTYVPDSYLNFRISWSAAFNRPFPGKAFLGTVCRLNFPSAQDAVFDTQIYWCFGDAESFSVINATAFVLDSRL